MLNVPDHSSQSKWAGTQTIHGGAFSLSTGHRVNTLKGSVQRVLKAQNCDLIVHGMLAILSFVRRVFCVMSKVKNSVQRV